MVMLCDLRNKRFLGEVTDKRRRSSPGYICQKPKRGRHKEGIITATFHKNCSRKIQPKYFLIVFDFRLKPDHQHDQKETK